MSKLIVTPVPDKTKPIEGKEYYFVRGKQDSPMTIHHGTCVTCDKCKKFFVVNDCQVTGFPQSTGELKLLVNTRMTNATELSGYDDETEMCMCENCYNETYPNGKGE
jgi:hypothetical protein